MRRRHCQSLLAPSTLGVAKPSWELWDLSPSKRGSIHGPEEERCHQLPRPLPSILTYNPCLVFYTPQERPRTLLPAVTLGSGLRGTAWRVERGRVVPELLHLPPANNPTALRTPPLTGCSLPQAPPPHPLTQREQQRRHPNCTSTFCAQAIVLIQS